MSDRKWRTLTAKAIAARPLVIGYTIQRETYGKQPTVIRTGLSWRQACKLLEGMPENCVMRIAGAPRKAYKCTAQRVEPHAQTERETGSEA